MIKFGTREAMEMFDMLRDSVCMIDHFADYIDQCQDPALKQILENQRRQIVESYNQKISIMQGHGLDISNVPRVQSGTSGQQGVASTGMAGMQGQIGMAGMQGQTGMAGMQGNTSNIQFGMQQAGQGQTQQYNRQRTLSDRTIALGALIFHKCGATRATTAALESAEPHFRSLASDSARNCMEMAYEIFRYMHQRGYYQMPETPVNFVNHMQYQGTQNNMQQNYPPMQRQNYQAGNQLNNPGQPS